MANVVVVDDNADHADVLALLFNTLGHTATVAYDGGAGLREIEARKPEIVFLDIDMPVLDGYEVARRVCSGAGSARPKLVAITGNPAADVEARARDAGFDYCFHKPADVRVLLALFGPTP